MFSFGLRLLQGFKEKGQLCIGIDPSLDQLESWNLPQSAEGAKAFSMALLDAAANQVSIVKPQVAFFEQFGPEGFDVLSYVLQEANSRQLIVIADAKRGDIGSTMTGYAKAWLSEEAVFMCDALTISPYLGLESLNQTVRTALNNNRGLFVLAATSNPEASSFQLAESDGKSLAKLVYDYASGHSVDELGSVGIVYGATVNASAVGIDLAGTPNFPLLVPGFGSQGVSLRQARGLLKEFSAVSICSVSRSVAGVARAGLEDRIAFSKSELEIGLRA